MVITVKQTDLDYFYLSTTYKGVRYGQGYRTTSETEARQMFARLIHTYRTKGDLYVMRNGAN